MSAPARGCINHGSEAGCATQPAPAFRQVQKLQFSPASQRYGGYYMLKPCSSQDGKICSQSQLALGLRRWEGNANYFPSFVFVFQWDAVTIEECKLEGICGGYLLQNCPQRRESFKSSQLILPSFGYLPGWRFMASLGHWAIKSGHYHCAAWRRSGSLLSH